MNTLSLIAHSFGVFVATFWWLVLILFAVLLLRMPFIGNAVSRIQTASLLKLFLDKNVYTVFSGVKLKTDSVTIPIDHVVVSRFGIIVIKSLRMPGWIYGEDNQKAWSCSFCKHTHQFYNPVMQIQEVAGELQNQLGISSEKILPLVVFSGRYGFKSLVPANATCLRECVKWIDRHTTQLLTDAEASSVCSKLKTGKYAAW